MESKQVNKLGKKIKEFRMKAGLSQDDLARKAGVAYTTLTKIETSVIKNPSVMIIAKISNALGIRIDDLIK